jgi:hypothetical protein
LDAPATAVQLSRTDRSRGWSVTTGLVVGAPAQPLFVGVGVAQWISCRSNAARIAVMCGVPSFRFPLSSSAASMLR